MATQLVSDSITTIAALNDDLLAEILQRVPSEADLVRATLAFKSWRRVATSSPECLRRYRSRHTSSPLVGFFISHAGNSLPSFELAGTARYDRYLGASARKGDFFLTRLESHQEWSLLDCCGGRVLLSMGDSHSLVVYHPVSGRRVPVCRPRIDPLLVTFASFCFMPAHADDDNAASFRVVSVQHRAGRDRMVRAVVYDSRTSQWLDHPWERKIKRPEHDQAMHAGKFIFWRYDDAWSLRLDTSKMEFSTFPLPCAFFQSSKYAIGDTEEGECCLVGLVGGMDSVQLQVWLLEENGAAKSRYPVNKKPVSQVLHRRDKVREIRAVTNGIALLCWDEYNLQFAVGLKNLCLKYKFHCFGLAYPMQLPWPPVMLLTTGSAVLSPCAVEAPKMNDTCNIKKAMDAEAVAAADMEQVMAPETEDVAATAEPQNLSANANLETNKGPDVPVTRRSLCWKKHNGTIDRKRHLDDVELPSALPWKSFSTSKRPRVGPISRPPAMKGSSLASALRRVGAAGGYASAALKQTTEKISDVAVAGEVRAATMWIHPSWRSSCNTHSGRIRRVGTLLEDKTRTHL